MDTFSTAQTVLRHGHMLQGINEVYKPLLYDSALGIRFTLACLYSASTYKVSSATIESLQLKVQGFGLQRPTGPS